VVCLFFYILFFTKIGVISHSGVTRGGQGGISATGRSTLGAPNWCRNVTY